MSVVEKKKSPYWHIDFWLGGRRYCHTSGTKVKKDAEALEQDWKAQIRAAMNRGPIKPVKDCTFDQAAGDYYRLRGKDTKDARGLYSEIERAMSLVGKKTRVSTMDLRCMMTLKEKFIEIEEKGHTRKKDEYRDGTVNGFLELVDRIVNHAIDVLKVVVENKAKPSKFLAPRYWRKRSLKDFEEKVLETITDQDLRDAWKFDLQTGLRSSALCGLTWDRVDLKERLITVPLKAKGKSVKPHQVYVSDEALGILLRRYGQHPKWVFTMIAQRESVVERVRRRAGERIPLKSGTFSKRMKEAFEKAKIEDFVVHDLRHTAAYRLWRDTSDIELVRVFLGHADVSQTRRYINVSAEDVAFAIRKKAERAGKRKKAKAGFDKDMLKQVLRRQFEDRMKEIRADEDALLV
jgi:integrase